MMSIYYFFFAEVSPTAIQFNAFWTVVSFLAFLAANVATFAVAVRRKRVEIDPQPVSVRKVGEMSSEKDCLARFEVTQRQIDELQRQRSADDLESSKQRAKLYDKIESVRAEMSSHTENVRKELSEKLDDVPDRVIATLKNTGAI